MKISKCGLFVLAIFGGIVREARGGRNKIEHRRQSYLILLIDLG